MDIQRPASNRKRNQRIATIIGVFGSVASVSVLAWHVSQRPPRVDADLVFWDEVRQGEFLYQVRGQGSLYAPETRSVTNLSDGVVEAIYVEAGHKVKSDDVLMRLSNPGLLQELADAEAELDSALADEDLRQQNAKGELLRLENDLASSEASFQEAYFKAESSRMLGSEEAVTELELMRDINQEEAARRRLDIAKQLVADYPDRKAAEDAQAESRLERQRRKLERLHERVRDLEIRAGIDGVVQVVAVEAGKRLGSGTEVARIVNPHHLIARVSVSERDEPLVELGQPVRLDLGRVSLAGVVSRKDPVVTDRYVTVDIKLVGESERQLTPDVSVAARIQIERVEDTLVVDKPSNLPDGQDRIELFRLNESGNRAELVSVAIGRVSVQEIEVLSGLEPGDRILQSDMSDWLEEPVIRIH